MSDSVIEIKDVSKHFTHSFDHTYSVKKNLINFFSGNHKKPEITKYVILDNVSFSIKKGEFVGIMGRNGAGKSTILKMISGIFVPNEGSIKTFGRIAPLLELGAGFVDELSGYENIFLNAAILGFSHKETQSKIKDIIDFSELGSKMEYPVRTYSSGMLVRLGFSIAAHLDADILLFDEILAVGDVGFQEKCLKKVKDLNTQGKSIILVTHTPDLVSTYCTRCILIDNSKIAFDGSPEAGAHKYRELFQI